MADQEKEGKKGITPDNRSDGAIRRFEESGPEKPVSRMELLDSFLKQITGSVSLHPGNQLLKIFRISNQ